MDISLPYSVLSKNGLNVFQTVIVNEKFAAMLEGNHIVLGGSEYIKALGMTLQVHFHRMICQNQSFDCHSRGRDFEWPVESISVKPEAPDERPDGVSAAKTMANLTCTVSNTASSLGAFKVVASTRLHITYASQGGPDANPALPSAPTSEARKLGLSQRLFGLDSIQTTLHSYIRDFSAGVQHFADIDDCSDVVHGILLYGLAGCGKRRLLHRIGSTQTGGQPWHSNIKFLSITPVLVNSWSSDRTNSGENPALAWLKGKCYTLDGAGSGDTASVRETAMGVVLLLPDFDTWLVTSGPGELSDFNTEAEGTGLTKSDSGQGHPLGKILEAIDAMSTEASAVGRRIMWCMVATATTAEEVFSLPECRQLFHRRLLVPLPDAKTRYSILRHQITSRLNALEMSRSELQSQTFVNTLKDSHVIECLVRVASKLHGYSPRDLHCLLKLSFSALLAKTGGDSMVDLVDLCQLIGQLSVSYLQGNLSHHLTPVEPLRWGDIGGYAQLKRQFQRVVQHRLAHAGDPDSPEARADAALGLRVPRGILLHGPPGCSKTMFVRALATECQLPLVVVQASRIFGRYVGDSERNMRRVLVQARASAPAILFIDEIDLLLPSRASSETGASEHVLGEVLTAMDGVEGQSGQLILVAATNRLEKLDTALSRAGRFDLILEVPPPDPAARSAIVALELSHRATDPQDDPTCSDWLTDFASHRLVGYTGAEVVQVVQYAAQLARDSESTGIGRRHLVEAQSLCPPRSLATAGRETSVEQSDDRMSVLDLPEDCLPIGYRCQLLLVLTFIALAYFFNKLYPDILFG